MTVRSAVLCSLLALCALLGLGWVFSANGLALRSTFGVRDAAVERTIYTQSASYRAGVAQDLRAEQVQYIAADANGKAALRGVIRHQVDGLDPATRAALPADVSAFVATLSY